MIYLYIVWICIFFIGFSCGAICVLHIAKKDLKKIQKQLRLEWKYCLNCGHYITGYEPLGEKRHEEKAV